MLLVFLERRSPQLLSSRVKHGFTSSRQAVPDLFGRGQLPLAIPYCHLACAVDLPHGFIEAVCSRVCQSLPVMAYLHKAAWHELACSVCGHAYSGDAAFTLGTAGLRCCEEKHGVESLPSARVLCSLAIASGDLGRYRQQLQLLQRALRIYESAFGGSHITVGVTLGLMADAHGQLGEYHKQKEAGETALRIEEAEFGVGSSKLCSTLTTVASAHRNLGNYQQQKDILERVLGIDRAVLGPEHVDAAATMVNLADAEGNLGNYAAQQELLEKALAIKDRSSLCISVAGVGNSVRSMQGTLGTILLLSGDWGVVRAPASLPSLYVDSRQLKPKKGILAH
ncbi:KLC4 [Symbiodinium microadriaticum]|nr:KLC4 [Symbiodinium microadriaticum]